MEPEDLDALYRIENDTTLWDIGPTNVPYSRYMLRDYIAHSSADIYTDKQVRQLIENAAGEVVGLIDLCNFEPRHLRAEVGIIIQNNCRRKGYATAAMLQLIDYSRRILHLHQLYAVVDSGNAQCLQLFLRLGFVQNATLKDWLAVSNGYRDAILLQLLLSTKNR